MFSSNSFSYWSYHKHSSITLITLLDCKILLYLFWTIGGTFSLFTIFMCLMNVLTGLGLLTTFWDESLLLSKEMILQSPTLLSVRPLILRLYCFFILSIISILSFLFIFGSNYSGMLTSCLDLMLDENIYYPSCITNLHYAC